MKTWKRSKEYWEVYVGGGYSNFRRRFDTLEEAEAELHQALVDYSLEGKHPYRAGILLKYEE